MRVSVSAIISGWQPCCVTITIAGITIIDYKTSIRFQMVFARADCIDTVAHVKIQTVAVFNNYYRTQEWMMTVMINGTIKCICSLSYLVFGGVHITAANHKEKTKQKTTSQLQGFLTNTKHKKPTLLRCNSARCGLHIGAQAFCHKEQKILC